MAPRKSPHPEPEPLAGLAGLDRLLEHRVRLAICVLLSRYDAMSFRRLRDLLDETDGSLGAHLRKLEDARYVGVKKQFVDRKPASWYRLSKAGRSALRTHARGLSDLLGDAGRA